MTPADLEALAADARDGVVRLSVAEARALAAEMRRLQAQLSVARDRVYDLLPCPLTHDGERTVLARVNEGERAAFERALAEAGW